MAEVAKTDADRDKDLREAVRLWFLDRLGQAREAARALPPSEGGRPPRWLVVHELARLWNETTSVVRLEVERTTEDPDQEVGISLEVRKPRPCLRITARNPRGVMETVTIWDSDTEHPTLDRHALATIAAVAWTGMERVARLRADDSRHESHLYAEIEEAPGRWSQLTHFGRSLKPGTYPASLIRKASYHFGVGGAQVRARLRQALVQGLSNLCGTCHAPREEHTEEGRCTYRRRA